MTSELHGTHQKALYINLDPTKYGTFAEIGAGQEVARWFFRVGGAAGTIAKTISAYDMTVSDAIYGQADRYVTRQRLQNMLDYEYGLMQERLQKPRGATTRFFVFADTVKARGYKPTDTEHHGWLGIRFQAKPQSDPSQIIIHVRMLDKEAVQQQEALGIMGVNVIYGALYAHHDPVAFIRSLMDDLNSARVEVDMIKFEGPDFQHIDNRLMSLELVQQGLSNAAMFTANGEVVQASEVLYKKPILVERGSFRPVTKVTLDMLHCAQHQFAREPQVKGEDVVTLMEMTLTNLTTEGRVDYKDFLDRADLLGSLGKTVLISNYAEFYRLATYLFRYTKKKVGIVMGVPTLRELFEEKYYHDLEGGILESFGRLFKNALRLYVYPCREHPSAHLTTAATVAVAPHLRHLHQYLLQNLSIQELHNFDEHCLPISSKDVLAKIRAADPTWETMVPPQVAHLIKQRHLFGFRDMMQHTASAAV
jgi:hypothetical protein